MTQAELSREVDALPMDRESWAGYAGLPTSQLVLVASRRSRIVDVPAILGTLETSLENLEGKFTRRQFAAMTLTPGYVWTLNCGVSTFKADNSRARFAALEATFNKVLGSFALFR